VSGAIFLRAERQRAGRRRFIGGMDGNGLDFGERDPDGQPNIHRRRYMILERRESLDIQVEKVDYCPV
jgi:hypothetical protein